MGDESKDEFHEALLSACRAVSWADGYRSESTVDCYTTLIAELHVNGKISRTVSEKWNKGKALDEMFDAAMKVLVNQSREDKLLSCAWMVKTAMISSTKGDSYVQHEGVEFWNEQKEFINNQEKEFLNNAFRDLEISEEEAWTACANLPMIKKV